MLGHHRHASLGNLPSEQLAPLLGTCAYNKDVEGPQFATVSTKKSIKSVKLSLHFKVASDCAEYTKTQSICGKASKANATVVTSDDFEDDSVPDLMDSPTYSDNLSLPDFDDFKGAIDCPEVTSEDEDAPIAYGAFVGVGSRQFPKRRAIFTLGDEDDVEDDEESTLRGEYGGWDTVNGVGLHRQAVGKEASFDLNKWFKQGGM